MQVFLRQLLYSTYICTHVSPDHLVCKEEQADSIQVASIFVCSQQIAYLYDSHIHMIECGEIYHGHALLYVNKAHNIMICIVDTCF